MIEKERKKMKKEARFIIFVGKFDINYCIATMNMFVI